MTTLAIVFGAISVLFLVTGVVGVIGQLRNEAELLSPWILLSIGSIGLWLCLTI
jgi:hypothetical protein